MKTRILLLFFVFISLHGIAQSNPASIKEIDQQVWKPFIESYNANDFERFNSLHSEDVMRVLQNGEGAILIGEEYFTANKRAFSSSTERNSKRELYLNFIKRIATEDHAFDIGIYKLVVTNPGKEPNTYYGLFHVILKKNEAGMWKIHLDTDGNTLFDMKVGEKEFNQGMPAQF